MFFKFVRVSTHFNKISAATLARGKAVPDGMYHLVCEIIVKHNDGTYLLMQRDFEKHLGGMWELTAGSSALKGETPMECAVRELREETGLVSCNLQELKRIIHDGHHSLYVEYLCITDWDKDAVILQDGETVDYKWVDKTALLEMGTDALASSRALEIVKELNI